MLTREEAKDKLEDAIHNEVGVFDEMYKIINKIYDEHEAQMKAKDTKARSIVAMLFWMMKRQKSIYTICLKELGNGHMVTAYYRGAYEDSNIRFKQAYKMLKENR